MENGQVMLATTKHRRGRRTARQAAALATRSPFLLEPAPGTIGAVFDLAPDVVLDIGFGMAEGVVAYAVTRPEEVILAIDMHTPGIGDLVASIEELGLTNVYVVDGDVRVLLSECLRPSSLSGVRTFYPDPWPKKRHHRRRLIQPGFIDLVADRVKDGGTWHIATDWPDYADHIEAVMGSSQHWSGGRVERPETRPMTKFERRGLAAGRDPLDFLYVRTGT